MRSPWFPRVGLGLLAAGVVGAIVSLSVGEGGPKSIQLTGGSQVQSLFGGVRQEGRRLGSADAVVTINVFNDLQCAPCAAYETSIVDALVSRYARGDTVNFEFRHLSFGGAETTLAASSAVAAGEQGFEWQYIDLFFRNQDQLGGRVTDSFLTDIAGAIPDDEFEMSQWRRDRASDATAAEVNADAQLADSLHLPYSSPSVVVTGPGAQKVLTDSPSVADVARAVKEVSG